MSIVHHPGYNYNTCLVYIEDVIIFSSSTDNHIEHFHVILENLRKADISLKIYKCAFLTMTVNYVGHIVYRVRLRFESLKNRKVYNLHVINTNTNTADPAKLRRPLTTKQYIWTMWSCPYWSHRTKFLIKHSSKQLTQFNPKYRAAECRSGGPRI